VLGRPDVLGRNAVEGMARIAVDEGNDVAIRAQMYADVAQYTAQRRKAVEATLFTDEPTRLVIQWVEPGVHEAGHDGAT
jgi:hypothetical protein